MTGVRIVSCRSANLNMFQMTYKYNSVSLEDFRSLKFPWKKVQHSEFSFPKMFDSYRDLFLNAYLSYPDISTFIDEALGKATNRYIYQMSPKFLVNVIVLSSVVHEIIYNKTIPKRRDWCRIFKCYYMIGERYIP